jgi:single-stranded DNA-binding protein
MIMSREKEILDEMKKWQVNDIIMLKGVIHTQALKKTSFCPNCTDADGSATKNETFGNLVTVTPIHVIKIKSYGDDKASAVDDVIEHGEMSNCIQVYGTLLKDPKLFTTKKNIRITQYPIAINRKFTVRTDDPSIKTDYPIVKSYGEQALNDKMYLHYQSEIIVDGFLQGRTVTRKCKCKNCGKIYEWTDNCMEIVPYAVEYVKNYKTPDDIAEEKRMTAEEYKQKLFNEGTKDSLDDDEKSSEIQDDDE